MLAPLRNRTFRRLYAAQVISLLGTGLTTVALALVAFDLAGEAAGRVLGTALAIKMIAYVGVAPIAQALLANVQVRRVLVMLDLFRAAVVLFLPFVDAVWQIYLLVFVLQSASAGFTPAFQAVIPEVLPDEEDYTQALSLSRLSYDLESLISPALAAAALTILSYGWLFGGNALGFLASAGLVLSTRLPVRAKRQRARFIQRLLQGVTIYRATPRLRGLFLLNIAAAAAGAMVLVNTVVIVRGGMGLSESDVGLALAAFGGGSMLAALAVPALLRHISDRTLMFAAGYTLVVVQAVSALVFWNGGGFALLCALWLAIGLGYSALLTPSARLLRRSTHPDGRPAIFAAQFALSHAGWLMTYSLAGWSVAALGLPAGMVLFAFLSAGGCAVAALSWRGHTSEPLEHVHTDLPEGHPHLHAGHAEADGYHHSHAIIIDDLHRQWPTQG